MLDRSVYKACSSKKTKTSQLSFWQLWELCETPERLKKQETALAMRLKHKRALPNLFSGITRHSLHFLQCQPCLFQAILKETLVMFSGFPQVFCEFSIGF